LVCNGLEVNGSAVMAQEVLDSESCDSLGVDLKVGDLEREYFLFC